MSASRFFSQMGRRFRAWRRQLSLRPLKDFGRSVGRLFAAGARRVRVWFHTRAFRLFLQGLPALLVGVGVLALLGISLTVPQEELQLRYLEQGKASFEGKDYPLAQVCYERVCQTAGDRSDVLFKMGLTAEALKQQDRAEQLMSQLAPADRQGYGEAHLWVAGRLMQLAGRLPHIRKVAETHLLRAKRGDLTERSKSQARGLLGLLYLAAGQLDQAEAELLLVVPSQPAMRLRLAKLYELRGDVERANREAKMMADHFRPLLKVDVYDNRARFNYAGALLFLKQFPQAFTVLSEGWAVTSNVAYRRAIGDLFASWYEVRQQQLKAAKEGKGEKEAKADKAGPDELLALLDRGLSWDPSNRALLNRLLEVVRLGGPEAELARKKVEAALAKGESPATAHFVLGADAFQRGREEEARTHWERANQLSPHAPDIANNLAFLLTRAAKPDLPRALKLADLAVQQVPDNPGYRDTRGQVYMKLGKWKEALADLEAALPRMPDNPALHRALAEVYERLGSAGMAAEHRRLAEKKAAPPPDGAGS